MGAPTSVAHNPRGLGVDAGRRRSMRVLLSVAVHVHGKDRDGQEFKEDTRTLVVNAHGALVWLAAQVSMGQLLTVSNKASNQSLECRVVHLGKLTDGKIQTGIEFVEPSPSFWRIDFPPEDWVVPAD